MIAEQVADPRPWRSDDATRDARIAPDLHLISGAPAADVAWKTEGSRPLVGRVAKHLRRVFDRLIAGSSLVPNDPVLDVRDFAWTQALRDEWRAIRAEATAAAQVGHAAPSLATISPGQRPVAEAGTWRSFLLWSYGYPIDANLARCPCTRAAIEAIPGLNSAFFSILAPGTHIPAHRGVTKGLITCHLGLIVPRDGDVRMRVDDRIVRWSEGETLVFDDTYDHEVWNDTESTRVVLLVQFERPLRQPGKWFTDLFLGFVKPSAFVQEARNNAAR